MANEKLYLKSPPPQIDGVDPFYVDRELTKIEQGFSKVESVVSGGGSAVDQDARDDISNLQTRVSTLEVTNGNAAALVEEERTARITADSAEALARLTLKAQVDQNTAEIVNTNQALVTKEQALAQQITTLNADYQGNKASVNTQLTAVSNSQYVLTQQVSTFSSQIALNSALIEEETTARVSEDEALAQRITSFQTEYNGNKASVQNQITALTNADQSLANTVSTLRADYETNKSIVTEELEALADNDGALASQIGTISVQANRIKTYRQPSTPLSAQVGELWFDTDDGNKLYRFDGTSWIPSDDTRFGSLSASISTEATARINGDNANATAIQNVSSSVNGLSSTVSTLSQSVNGISAKWGVRINNNGAITGIELNSGADARSTFKVQADRFVLEPQGGGAVSPFYVEGNTTYIENAVIKNGSLTQMATAENGGNSVSVTLSLKGGSRVAIFGSHLASGAGEFVDGGTPAGLMTLSVNGSTLFSRPLSKYRYRNNAFYSSNQPCTYQTSWVVPSDGNYTFSIVNAPNFGGSGSVITVIEQRK